MKYILVISFLLSCVVLNAQDVWQQRDSVNGPGRSVAGAFVLMGEGYIVAGLDDFTFKRKMYSYNMFQDDWDDEESIGGANGDGLERGSATTFSIGFKGYVCFGQGQTVPFMSDLWEFNLETGAWSQKADFIGSARRSAVAFVIDDKAYIGTGEDASGVRKDFYKYDPADNSWTQLNDFQGTARRQAVAFSLAGYGWLGTGDDGVMKKDFWMYNPTLDSWTQKTDFPGTARAGAVGWATFPTAFIATGEDINLTYKKDVWEYNYYANVWVQRTDFPGSGRKNAIAFVIDNVAFVGTGYSGIFEDDFYAYFGIAGLDENSLEFNSMIYPNPAQNKTIITCSDVNINDLDLSVFSISGQDLTQQVESCKTGNSINLNVSQLSKGNYIYRLTNKKNGQYSFGKFLVQ